MPLLGNIFSRAETKRSQSPGSDLSSILNEGIQWADSSLTNQNGLEPSLNGGLLNGGLLNDGLLNDGLRNAGSLDGGLFNGQLLNGGLNRDAERATCGNALCSTGWVAPWKDRRRPFFDGKWACSSRCLSAMVKAAIAQETGGGRGDGVPVQHRHRVPLGLIMLAQGWITHPQLQKALEAQKANGSGRIGDWLVSECGLESECVTRGLGMQWSCPVLTTDGFSPQAMAMAVPRLFVEEYGILPLRIAGSKTLYLGFQDHLDAMSAFAVEQMNGIKTESGVVTETRFREAQKRLLESQFAEFYEDAVPDTDTLATAVAALVEEEQPVASRLVRMHQYYWLRIWSQTGPRRTRDFAPARSNGPRDFVFTVGEGN